MSLTTRVLPPEEWPKLAGHPALGGFPLPPVGSTDFIVAEEGERIVGVWAKVTVIHLEPVWIAGDRRGGLVLARMWRALHAQLAVCGVAIAYAFCDRPEIAGYLERLGLTKLPYAVFLHEA